MSRSSWIDEQESLPPCPECGHNVFVHGCRRQYNDWLCEGCGGMWRTGETETANTTGHRPGGRHVE